MSPRRQRRHDEEARLRAAHTVSLMRTEDLSLKRAARKVHTKPSTVRHYFASHISRDDGGRYRVSPSDRLSFRMVIVSKEEGVTDRVVRGSRKRELLGAYHNAVGRYLRPGGGDPAVLRPFEGRRVAGLTLLTDPDALEETWRVGQLDFLEIYALAA